MRIEAAALVAVFIFNWILEEFIMSNVEKKDIRFIAVNFDDQNVKDFMSNNTNAFTEIDKQKFDRSVDGLSTSYQNMNNYVSLIGRLVNSPKTIAQGDHSFIYASLSVESGYFDKNHNYQKHEFVVPLRLNMKQNRIMLAQAGDMLQVTGQIIRFIGQDEQDLQKATSYYYLDVINCGLLIGLSTVQKNVVYLTGKLQSDPEIILNHSQSDTKFVSAKIVIPDGYRDGNGEFHKHTEVIMARFYNQIDEIMTAKQGDTVHLTGNLRSWGIVDPQKDTMKATQYLYVNVKGFGIMYGSSIRKQVKAKFYPKPRPQTTNNQGTQDITKILANLTPAQKAALFSELSVGNQEAQQAEQHTSMQTSTTQVTSNDDFVNKNQQPMVERELVSDQETYHTSIQSHTPHSKDNEREKFIELSDEDLRSAMEKLN